MPIVGASPSQETGKPVLTRISISLDREVLAAEWKQAATGVPRTAEARQEIRPAERS
jgi:hypothetical protein